MTGIIPNRDQLQKIFFLLIVCFLSYFFVGNILTKGPINTHMWRQADCLSMTKKYQEGADFWKPEMHIQLADNLQSGKSAGEFPVLYWAIGNIWKLTGSSHFIYRCIYLIIMIGGVYSLFLLLRYFFSFPWSATLALSLFYSPIYLYYGVSFLTDGPALAFALMGAYQMTTYFIRNKVTSFWWALFLFALVGLLKISSLILFVFILFMFLLERVGVKLVRNRQLFKNKGYEYVGFILVLVVIFSWYFYASYYNSVHQFKYTFNNIFPFWLTDEYDLSNLLEEIKNHTLVLFINKWALLILVLLWGFNLFRFKKQERLLSLVNLIIPFGAFIYVALWFPLFGVHDYYYMPLIIIIPSVLIPFFFDLKSNFPAIFKHRVLKIGMLLFLSFNLLYTHQISRLKTGKLKSATNPVIQNKKLVESMNWTNYHVETDVYQFYRIKNHLLKLGFAANDKIIVLSDDSFNISLYLLDRGGWTNFMSYNSLSEIEHLKHNANAKILLIHQNDFAEHDYLDEIKDRYIDQFEDLLIYKL